LGRTLHDLPWPLKRRSYETKKFATSAVVVSSVEEQNRKRRSKQKIAHRAGEAASDMSRRAK